MPKVNLEIRFLRYVVIYISETGIFKRFRNSINVSSRTKHIIQYSVQNPSLSDMLNPLNNVTSDDGHIDIKYSPMRQRLSLVFLFSISKEKPVVNMCFILLLLSIGTGNDLVYVTLKFLIRRRLNILF